LVIFLDPGKLIIEPLFFLYSFNAFISMPPSFKIAPFESEIAMILCPWSVSISAALPPTFPNP